MGKKKAGKRIYYGKDTDVSLRQRTLVMMGIMGVGVFVILLANLFYIQIIQHDFYAEEALDRQTQDYSVTASRGSISDRKGNLLAISATTYNVVLSPKDIAENEFDGTLIANGLAQILDVDREKILTGLENTSNMYFVVASKIEEEQSDLVRSFISEYGYGEGIYLMEDSKRYYASSSLAAQVIGFVNSDNNGAYGLEAIYDSELSGQAGRIVTTRAANGVEMMFGNETYVDAENGQNLNLTIDSTIQYYAERTVSEGIEKFDVEYGGFCIVMNPKTGEIYACVSNPDYDLNNPSQVFDETALAALDEILLDIETNPETTYTNDDYLTLLGESQLSQWRNKAVNDTYEPGSTFKPIVMAMGLEEGLISVDDCYYCSGSVMVDGWDEPISCSVTTGHGWQTLEEVLMNSCNPGMIEIAAEIGNADFYSYVEDFGLLNTTGVDLQGEGVGNFWTPESFLLYGGDIVSLATASFGQRFQVTPIALITALAAVINGGYLVEPYVVSSITDDSGNVVSYHDTEVVRQVISNETSEIVKNMMVSVVSGGGTGKNAAVEGYSIGGKTGSSETIYDDDRIIVSFVGFAPAEDPEIIVLLGYDGPKPASTGANYTADGYYISGGNMAAPMAGELIEDILEYMGYAKQDSSVTPDVSMPDVVGKRLDEAQRLLTNAGLDWKLLGDEAVVTAQTPSAGVTIPEGSAVVLYLGEEKTTEKVEVPDITGRTYQSVTSMLDDKGLYLKASGLNSTYNMVAYSQSIEAGTMVDVGTVIEVRFMDNSITYGD